ncbi:MAG: hypothetical protein BWY52_00865 [Chloroflexi bacterium ADurb.Bin325]|nr:MAG: hypothetical protein BWY52_00865 [Chloroflexi bacterium ADurb.Bin325]
MSSRDYRRILDYRADTYRLRPSLRLQNKEQAIALVEERGFIFFWPVKGVELPSLWAAVAGDRPVAGEHDDPGHVTWGWKDELLGARVWYYAKVLRKKSTFVAHDALPYFYALSENYGAPEEDYLQQYRDGRLSHEAKTIYEALLSQGPLDSPALRRAAHMTARESDTGFQRGMLALQADFKVLPIGVAQVGAWKYAFIYELTHRRYPDLAEQARPIRQAAARARLAELYLRTVGAAQARQVEALFGWPKAEVAAALSTIEATGVARSGVRYEALPGEWWTLAELL